MDAPRATLPLRFGTFAFDEADARLTANGHAVALAPKAFAVLGALLRNAGQLVTKEALLDAVWGHRHVSESVLKTTISELRAALGDDAKRPRWIETASRRGYRFIGSIERGGTPPPPLPMGTPASPVGPNLIGRAGALGRLRASWASAASGHRQLFFVAGEAGIGKSTLIDAFCAGLGEAATAHGQCIERVGEGEPYLPLLDALSGLAREDASLVSQLRRFAPTWLLQLPWLIEREELERLQLSLASSTQDRMLREFSELIEQITAVRPLVLVTEDLHWSDEATVRLIDHVARRRPAARLMWLATYRTPELVADDHPLNGLRHELRARRLCEELLLDPFSESELAEYLAHFRPELTIEEPQIRRLHRHTDGLPLFIVNAVDEIAEPSGEAVSSDDWAVPDSLMGTIERQRHRMTPVDATLLEAAAVCGVDFECSIVGAMLERDVAEVAAHCEELVRRLTWLAAGKVDTLADGTLEARFTFRHALYRQALYQRIAPAARAGLHRLAAAAIERQHAGRLESFAAVLALHHERGLDAIAAMRAYAIASERALGRFAPAEALLLTAHGLALLARAPATSARDETEFALQHARSSALAQSTGTSTSEARAVYRRCIELYELLPPSAARAWVVAGLVWMLDVTGEYVEAEAMALRLRAAAEAFDDDTLRAAAAVAQAVPLLQRGLIDDAAKLLEESHSLTHSLGRPRSPPTVLHDISTVVFGIGAVIHAFRGEIKLARDWADESVARAEQLGQPVALGMAARCANLVDVLFERPEAVLARSQRVLDAMRNHHVGPAVGTTQTMLGWARACVGQGSQGLREAEEGCAAHAAMGTWFEATCLWRLAAEAALAVGDLDSARRHIDDAFSVADRIGERLHLPYLWITRAKLMARTGDPVSARTAAKTAIALALASGAPTPELAARLALCELPGAASGDFEALRKSRARWVQPMPWPALIRVDALLADHR